MTLNNETISEAPDIPCEECGWVPTLDVYSSAAGFYIGTWCGCGPYSRESSYYATNAEATSALREDAFTRAY